MDGNRRWFIPVRRLVISAVLSIIAFFVIFGSWGMESWRWMSVGIALLAGAVGLAIISAMTSTISGVAHVLAVNDPPAVKHFGRCAMSVIITAKNTEPIFMKLLEDDVPLGKWPHVRDDLPVSVAAADARVVTVLWDKIPSHKRAGAARRRAQARDEFQRVRAEATASGGGADAGESADTGSGRAQADRAQADRAQAGRARPVHVAAADREPTDPEPVDVTFATPEPADSEPADSEPAEVETAGSDDDVAVEADAEVEPDGVNLDSGQDVPRGNRRGAGVVVDLAPSEYSVTATGSTGSRASAVITSEQPRRKPSPRPRPRPPAEDLSGEDSVAAGPIRIGHVGVVTPAMAPLDDDTPYDQNEDIARLADAYRAAAPPPGSARGGAGITVTLLISDLSRSIIFYRDVLGFREIDAGRGTAVLEYGDARVLLRVVKDAAPTQRLVQMLLEVPNVDQAHRDLLARGVTFLHRPRRVGQYEQLELHAAALRDPDGHGIAIAQWRDARG